MRQLIGRAGSLRIPAPATPMDDRVRGADHGDMEDFWDPVGVPGPVDIALADRPKRLRWWFWAVTRR